MNSVVFERKGLVAVRFALLLLFALWMVFALSTAACRAPQSDPEARPVYPREDITVVPEPPPPPPAIGRLQVCGSLDEDKPGYRFSSAKLEDFPIGEYGLVQHLPGPFSMVLVDRDGRVLSEEKFGPMTGHAARRGLDGKIDCRPVTIQFSCMNIPYVPGTARLEVRLDETVLETFTPSENSPELRITSPRAHSKIPKRGELKIAWEAKDPDGDELFHSIYYRTSPGDGGLGEWEVVIGDFAETRMDLDASFFPPGPEPELMVLTTDRFNTTRIVVPLKGPHDAPRDGTGSRDAP
jgi:hypothetical protein